MYLPPFLYRELRAIGYREPENIAEFWFQNRAEISTRLNIIRPTLAQIFEDQIRWKSPVGQDCQRAVRKRFEDHQMKIAKLRNEAFERDRKPFPAVSTADRTLDLRELTFESGGKTWALREFQELYPNAKVYPHANLSGIDLSGLRLSDCILYCIVLTHSNLDDSTFSSLDLIETRLGGASIRNARLQQLRFQNSHMTEADVSGTFLNVVQLDDSTVSSSLRYTEVGYLHLLRLLAYALFNQHTKFHQVGSRKHTDFLLNSTTNLTLPESKPFKTYVTWYQFVMKRLREFNTLSFPERFLFSMSLVFTKAWRSYSVLALWGALSVVTFALYFHTHTEQFEHFQGEMDGTFLTALYFSVVTFATLGYGDITPKAGIGQIIVMAEVILGYITLGCFAFLIGHKVGERF